MTKAPIHLSRTVADLRCFLRLARREGGSSAQLPTTQPATFPDLGFVPTMGALHLGHLSLIQRARYENKIVLVSIFVNPLQFGPLEDFHRYPANLAADQALCEQAGVDAIFAPSEAELVSQDTTTRVVPPLSMTEQLCGKSRPGHFQGVATIVTKLLNLVQPERVYFGQKDAQQLAIVQRLVKDLNFSVEIVPCPVVREASGLAYSSRNHYLTSAQKQQAAGLYRSLNRARQVFRSGVCASSTLIETVQTELAPTPDVKLEYIELVHPTTLTPLEKVEDVGLLAIAARVGSTRLIDNVRLHNRKPILAIDGPAGAGKSTVTRRVAEILGLLYLDTGAMYRAVTWLVLESGLSIQDEVAVAELVQQCQIQLSASPNSAAPPQVFVNGQEVSQAIRSLEVTAQVSAIAAQPAVRRGLVKQQQRYGQVGGVAVEGRDIGTHVFPDAELKIFLTASVQERARRRQKELNQTEIDISLEQLQRDIDERDHKDSTRSVAPLRKAADAVEIYTDNLSITEVINQIVALYRQRFP